MTVFFFIYLLAGPVKSLGEAIALSLEANEMVLASLDKKDARIEKTDDRSAIREQEMIDNELPFENGRVVTFY